MENLIDVLIARAQDSPDATAFIELNRRGRKIDEFTYSSLFERAASIAISLQSSCRQEAHLLLVIPHGLSFIAAFYGCLLAKCVAVPYRLPTSSDSIRIAAVFKTASISAVLTVRSQESKLREMLSAANIAISLIFVDELDSGAAPLWRRPNVTPNDLAIIQFTSGTTTAPKGVAITHGALAYNSESIRLAFRLRTGHTGVSWLPFTHDMGLIGHVVQPVYSGLRNVFMSPIAFVSDPSSWLRAISDYSAYCSGAPNFAYRLCSEKVKPQDLEGVDLSAWQLAFCGSERIEPTTALGFINKFNRFGFEARSFYPCYGLAESTLFVTGRHGIESSENPITGLSCVSVGNVVDGRARLKVVDPETLCECDSRSVGEIWIKSQSNTTGYFGEFGFSDDSANCSVDAENGFVRSGDLGYLDDGELYVVGRIKDVIKVRGLAVAAEDIELAVSESAHNLGLCIYGVAAFTVVEDNSERIVVLTEVDKTVANIDTDMRDHIRQSVCDRLGVVLGDVVFVPRTALPKTASGKVKRRLCEPVYFSNRPPTEPDRHVAVLHIEK